VSAWDAVGAWLRRTFGGLGAVIKIIARDAIPVIVEECRKTGVRTDAQRREVAKRVVAELITLKYPAYGFLVDRVVDFLFESVREQLKRRSK
jgi:hypothetical protein